MEPTKTSARKDELFMLRLSSEEKAVMREAAMKTGLTLSGFLRSNGLAAAAREGVRLAA